MDANESDHSITWEDFFGSTTDLTPTLLGIYDSLLDPKVKSVKQASQAEQAERQADQAVKLEDKHNESVELKRQSYLYKKEPDAFKDEMEQKSKEDVNKLPVNVNRDEINTRSTECGSKYDSNDEEKNIRGSFLYKHANSKKKVSAFDTLSPNVKRMLESVDANTVSALKQKKVVRASMRGPKSFIPLVGATSKISQSGVDILDSVQIYDKPVIKRNEEPKLTTKTLDLPAKNVELPTKQSEVLPKFKINSTDESNVSIYDVPKSKYAFDSLSLPFIDQSLEISPSNDREFDTKIKSPINNNPINETKLKHANEINNKEEIYKSNKNAKVDSSAEEIKPEKDQQITVTRPLSMSSIASSSSSSSSGVQNKGVNSAYLASIESLDDHSDDMVSNAGSNNFVNSTRDVNVERLTTLERTDGGDGSALSQLERVCAEIVETENLYVEDLRQVVEGYLHFWRENDTFSSSDLAQLFNNIEEIYTFNRSLCDGLNGCQTDPVSIAKLFTDNSAGFTVYASYCTGYPQTMSRLAEMMASPPDATECRMRQAALTHALPLGSYLLKPVQRILKYHLLLQNVVKHCRCPETELALLLMTEIARRIDDMKRRHEHAVRVQEIQSLLYGWSGPDLTTYGELCAEGTFRVFGAKAMRHAFLFDKILLLTKNREDGILAYKSHIMCNNLMLVESIDNAPLSFHVIPWDNPRAQLTLMASSQRQKREWTLLLKRVILENYNAVIPSHARRLVMELGQNKTDDDILAEKSRNLITHTSMRKQLSAPEYLEKRKLERERRKTSENRMNTTSHAQSEKPQCDCANISIERGRDYTCEKCYIDLCSDCERELKKREFLREDKCADCDKTLHFIDAGSADNLERKQNSCKCDFKSSQESFTDNTVLTNRAYHSSDNISAYADKSDKAVMKTCLKCAKIKENIVNETKHGRKSRVIEHESKNQLRSKSKDDPQRSKLSKIGNWRRKSEPGLENGINIANIANMISKKNNENDKASYGNEKIEFECRNCGSTAINRNKQKYDKLGTDSDQSSTKGKESKNLLEIQKYNTKHVPKKISKLRKNRAKGKRLGTDMTARFYADFSTDVSTENILHISESTDSLNNLPRETVEPSQDVPKHDTDIDEETYKKLIEKTDSFKKNELEKGKYLNQQKVIKEGAESENEQSNNEKKTKEDSEEETEKPLEQIISQLLMQNREFQKILKKQQQRSGAHRRNQRLLKSHSNPEDPTVVKKDNKKPKYARQYSSDNYKRSPNVSPRVSPSKEVSHLSDEEHIYEQLRVELKNEHEKPVYKQISTNFVDYANKDLNKLSHNIDSDYVYLTFDKINKTVNEDGIYDVPSSIPVKKPVKQTDYYVAVNSKNIYDRVGLRNKEKESKIDTGDYLPMNKEQQNPNTPEIWLNRQKEHFNVSRDRKSGSLPRSFQVGDPSIAEKGLTTFKGKTSTPNKTYLNKDGKVVSTDRPFTIASDKSEISYEDISTYMSENDVLKYKSSKQTSGESISKSTLDLEEEIDRCYKNNFERNVEVANKEEFDGSQNNLNASVNSSCEVLPQTEKQKDENNLVHPEHKIYKPNTNFSIRNVLNRFKTKSSPKHAVDDEKEQNSSEQSPETVKTDAKSPTSYEKRSALNPKSYSRNLLQRFKSIIADEHPENESEAISKTSSPIDDTQVKAIIISAPIIVSQETEVSFKNEIAPDDKSDKIELDMSQLIQENAKQTDVFKQSYKKSISINSTSSTSSSPSKIYDKNKLPIYKQGSNLLGARIAQSDYVDPLTLHQINSNTDLSNVNVLINRNSIRPDSFLSTSSFVTTSSEGIKVEEAKSANQNPSKKQTNGDRQTNDKATNKNEVASSDDSFYEKSFEKIEDVRDETICRDSAIYSDQEENDSASKPFNPSSIWNAGLNQRNNARLEKPKMYKSEISTLSSYKTEIKSNSSSTYTSRESVEIVKPKTAPPLPVKPKLIPPAVNRSFIYSKTSTKPVSLQNQTTESNRSSVRSNISTETSSSKSNSESLSKSQSVTSDSGTVKSRITLRYQSFKSVDETSHKTAISNPRLSLHNVSTREYNKINDKKHTDEHAEDNKRTSPKSVMEIKTAIESKFEKDSPLKTQRSLQRPRQFNKPTSQNNPGKIVIMGPGKKDDISAKNIPKTEQNAFKEAKMGDETRNNDSAETSWVKTIVNKFQ